MQSQKWSDLQPDKRFSPLQGARETGIVSFGVDDLDMSQSGETLDANTEPLIDDPDVIVIDTRNDYEIDIGSFEGAVSAAH